MPLNLMKGESDANVAANSERRFRSAGPEADDILLYPLCDLQVTGLSTLVPTPHVRQSGQIPIILGAFHRTGCSAAVDCCE